jgi:hypothetical protein
MAVNTPSGVHSRQRLSSPNPMAGFQVSIDGRIWVSTEAHTDARMVLFRYTTHIADIPRSVSAPR